MSRERGENPALEKPYTHPRSHGFEFPRKVLGTRVKIHVRRITSGSPSHRKPLRDPQTRVKLTGCSGATRRDAATASVAASAASVAASAASAAGVEAVIQR